MLGNRAIYHDGWVAATTPAGAPWLPVGPDVDPITGYAWELYHVADDFSESVDLASRYPERLSEMQALFYAEAKKYNVLPIDNTKVARLNPAIRPSLTRGRTSFTYFDGMTRIPEGAAPDLKNKSFRISADVETTGDDHGVLVTQGGLFGGYALTMRGGVPAFHYNFVDRAHYEVAASRPLAPGRHTIAFDFRYDGGGPGKGGTGTLSVDGKQVAQGRIEHTIPFRISFDEGLDVGSDTGTPVSLDYDVPFEFSGRLERVTIDIAAPDRGAT
jgi:arylsulfatase